MAAGSSNGGGYYGSGFERPDAVIKIRKKRALQHRLESSGPSAASPSKRPREWDGHGASPNFMDYVPGEDDDSLMSLFYGKPNPLPATAASTSLLTALQFSSAPPSSPSSVRRQALTPAPPHLTPSPSRQPSKKRLNRTSVSARKLFTPATLNSEQNVEEVVTWRASLPLDWSLKTKVTFSSLGHAFPWRSVLGAAEESTGTSAFVRCQPEDSGLLDTSWGARLRSATLYWTHPALPNASPIFPPGTQGRELDGIRLEERITDALWEEWTESFRSLFHLVRSRQAPFFYITPPGQGGLTFFFSAAGTQGLPHLQVYVTPSSRGFRDALTQEGIDFTMPYYVQQEGVNGESGKHKLGDDSDEEEDPENWMDEMGITSALSISSISKTASQNQTDASEEKKKSSLVLVVGTQAALLLFNFLLNSKAFLVPASGPYKGIPPTLLSSVAFVGASLKLLQVRHSKTRTSGGSKISADDSASSTTKHTLEIAGPILPSVLLDLTSLLSPVIPEFTMTAEVCKGTTNFNVSQEGSQHQRGAAEAGSAAFEIQNLSDCGLKRSVLEHFCTSPSASSPYTVLRQVVARNGMFHVNPHVTNRLTQRTFNKLSTYS